LNHRLLDHENIIRFIEVGAWFVVPVLAGACCRSSAVVNAALCAKAWQQCARGLHATLQTDAKATLYKSTVAQQHGGILTARTCR